MDAISVNVKSNLNAFQLFFYAKFAALLRERLSTCSSFDVKESINSDDQVLPSSLLTSGSPLTEVKEKHEGGVGHKTVTEVDGPGEHEDVVALKHSKEIEQMFLTSMVMISALSSSLQTLIA